ncbi:MAG: Flp pilus assembly complex ATPase component TadA [Rubrivivax sp.]|nr:Flp pilus assembly complex ATPase component TadA [Rubrivivax sp.]
MSDLSHLPLSLVPLAGEAAAPAPSAHEPFAWPTPALGSYPVPTCALEPEGCEIEGVNGRTIPGRLSLFSPAEGHLQLQVSNVRAPLTLRFSQFRRLTLLSTLVPISSASGADPADPLNQRPAVPYKITMLEGGALEGLTLGAREEAWGVFLFEPVDRQGGVRRRFIPRAAYERLELGPRIGELLVEQQAATREQVEEAAQEQTQLRAQKLGDVLLVRQVVTAEQLEAAIAEQGRMPMVRIGEALVALGFISQVQLDAALDLQRADRGMPLGELLVRKGVVSRHDLQVALSRKMGYPMVDLRQFSTEADAVARVPHAVAQRREVLPLMLRGGRLVVAIDDPGRREALEEVEFVAQLKLVSVLADTLQIPAAIERAYDRLGVGAWLPGDSLTLEPDPSLHREAQKDIQDARGLLATMELQVEQREEPEEPPIEQSDNSLVKLINRMIQEAQAQGVSDIHIECPAGREKVRIRFRKDGRLGPYMELPHTYRAALLARLKIMCDLDISERRKPQDGKINFGKFQPGARLELRLATIPTHSNLEDAVLRLLASAKPLPLEQLGLAPNNLKRLQAAMQRPYGMVLCVGPTGSGKTTTLHSAMAHINTPDRKIWTAEDPIEITQSGLRQVQVNSKIDWTFAKALRSFLRADPDVIMVGEIRDRETAQMAVEASLTGHLVLSTLHTNSAAETVTRLLDMGMDPFNFADSLLAVVAQRLVRRLCPQCRSTRPATADEVDELAHDWLHVWGDAEGKPTEDTLLADWTARHAKDGRLMFHHSTGCPTCDQTGLKGRVALHELLEVTREQRRLIQTGTRAELIQATAMGQGLRTLRQDGIEKVLAGLTTIEEVRACSNS